MRVTANTFNNALVEHLSRLALRQNRLQAQAATGQRLRLPEDDPAGMRRVLDLQREASSLAQYQRNIERHQELAATTFSAIKSLKRLVDRASEIATLADGLKSPQELQTYATEVNALLRQAVQLANTKNRGDYVFAGTRADQPAFVVTTDATGLVTAVTYQGNTTLPESEIAEGVTVATQALGANTSGAGPRGVLSDPRVGADVFAHLLALRDHLASGNTAAIAQMNREQLAADAENLVFHLGTSAAVQEQLEISASLARSRGEQLGRLISREADADLAQTLVRLSETQTAYQAALKTGAALLNSSLLDYLR